MDHCLSWSSHFSRPHGWAAPTWIVFSAQSYPSSPWCTWVWYIQWSFRSLGASLGKGMRDSFSLPLQKPPAHKWSPWTCASPLAGTCPMGRKGWGAFSWRGQNPACAIPAKSTPPCHFLPRSTHSSPPCPVLQPPYSSHPTPTAECICDLHVIGWMHWLMWLPTQSRAN